MKICIINNLYEPYNRGGAEQVVKTIANGLTKAGHNVFIIATKPYNKNKHKDNIGQNIKFFNGLYYNLNKLPKPARLIWHIADIFSIRRFFQIRLILRKEQPDAVITHNLKGAGMLIPRAIRSLGITHVHTLHDIQLLHPSGLLIHGREKIINSLFSKIYQSANRRLINRADILISPSQWLLDEHVNRGFFKSAAKTVMPNPAPAADQAGVKKKTGNFKFLYAGQIEKHKGILILIEAFKKYIAGKGIKDAELAIAGEGGAMRQAKKTAEPCRNIKFMGKVANHRMLGIMKESDCLVAPSLCYENSPTVIYEALACGLPAIASGLGGTKELFADDRFLFKPADINSLGLKLIWAYNHREDLAGLNKKNQLNNSSLIDNYVKKLTELLAG